MAKDLSNKITNEINNNDLNSHFFRTTKGHPRDFAKTNLLRQEQIAKLHTSIQETKALVKRLDFIIYDTENDNAQMEHEALELEISICEMLLSLLTKDLVYINKKLTEWKDEGKI